MNFCTEPSSIWRCIYITTVIQLGVVVNSLKTDGGIQQTQVIIIWSRVHFQKLRQLRNSTPSHHHHHHISIMELGNLLTHSNLTYRPSMESKTPLLWLYICYWFISWVTWNQSRLSSHISLKYILALYSHLHCVPRILGFLGGGLWIFPLPLATMSTCLPSQTPGFHHHKL